MGGSSKSESESGASFNQSVWSPQGAALGQLYGQLSSLFGNTTGGIQGQIPGSVDFQNQIADATAQGQDQLLSGGAYGGSGALDQLMQSLSTSLNQPSNTSQIYASIMGGEGNTYADALKDTFISDANRAQDNMLANLDARAAASGMSGGARHGVGIGRGMEDINRNLQRNMTRVGYDTFDKDLGNKLNIAQLADSNQLSQQQMLSDLIAGEQNSMVSGVNAGNAIQQLGMGQFAPWMMPWQVAGMYANAIGRPTILGSGTQSGSSDSKGFGIG